MAKIFLWSDLHLGHRYVAALRGYDDVAEHDAALADAWASAVGPRDTVWVLGDVCLGNFETKAAPLLSRLPGQKHLVLGNHDEGHPAHRGWLNRQRRYHPVFDSVHTAASVRHGGSQVLLSHFPYDGDHEDVEERFAQWRLPDLGAELLHGHLHETRTLAERQLNVGVDVFPGGPVELGRAVAILRGQETL